MVANIAECMKTLSSSDGINKEIIDKLMQQAAQALNVCQSLKKQVIKNFEKEDMDEDTQEEFDEQYDEANLIMDGKYLILPIYLFI